MSSSGLDVTTTSNGSAIVGRGCSTCCSARNASATVVPVTGQINLRWEYVPGSVLFVAWQHGRSDRGLDGEFGGFGAVPDLFGLESDNTLLVKVSYWLAL